MKGNGNALEKAENVVTDSHRFQGGAAQEARRPPGGDDIARTGASCPSFPGLALSRGAGRLAQDVDFSEGLRGQTRLRPVSAQDTPDPSARPRGRGCARVRLSSGHLDFVPKLRPWDLSRRRTHSYYHGWC